jgi:formate hydrogenlyase subunit 6/NADH:ubiquinone oxidoreductase subunit I
MKLPKVRETLEAVKSLTHRPYTSAFPAKPHVPFPSFRGQPKYDVDACVGCLACEEVCPAEAIGHRDVTDEGAPRRLMLHYTDTCIFCGCCEDACINDHRGIKLSNDWELSFFDRAAAFESIEKELQLCEACGAVVGCKDHLRWIAGKLGELSFSNPTLYQSRLRDLGVVDDNMIAAARGYGRADRMKILCARCRRETTLTTAPPRPGAAGEKAE